MTPEQTAQLANLIGASIELTRTHMQLSAHETGFADALQQINAGLVRIRVVIEYNPVPSVTCELVREEDGEYMGYLFQLTARNHGAEH